MPDTTFYYATFRTEGNFYTLTDDFSEDLDFETRLRERFEEFLSMNEPVVRDDHGDWYCGEFEQQGDYYLGEFGRQFEDESKIYDEEKGKFITNPEPSIDADSSQFILDIDQRLLIYNTGARLGRNQFRSYFQQGFNNKAGGGLIEIEPLVNRDSLERVLQETRVLEAKMALEPTNPSPLNSFQGLDERMQRMLATKLGIDAYSEDGLNVSEELLAQAISMGDSDYGEYRLIYDDDGNPKIISSGEEEQVTREESAEIDSITALSSVAEHLRSYGLSFSRND